MKFNTSLKNVFIEKNSELITTRTLEKGLYYVVVKVMKGIRKTALIAQKKDVEIKDVDKIKESTIYKWHFRLGYIGIQPLLKILKDMKEIIKPEEVTDFKAYKCPVCQKLKI